MQSGNPIQAPQTAPAGGSVEVRIQDTASSVWVQVPGEPYRQVKVPKSRKITIPVPNAPGEIIEVNVERGGTVRGVSIVIVPSTV